MNNSGLFLLATVALMEVVGFSSACRRADKAKTIEIAFVVKALDSEYWQRAKSGAEEAARAEPGVKLSVLAPEREVNIDQQVSILENQITKGVSALAVAPAGAAEVVPVLEHARLAGIPVLIADTDINWPAKLSYIGADNQHAGRIAGEFIVNALGGKGRVAVIRGILGVATHEDRLAGFRAALSEAPGIEIVAVQPANSERALGMSVMENLLTSHPEIRAVFATNDQMALGAVEAIAARHLTSKIAVVGVDATSEAVRAIQAGRLSADVALHPEALGKKAVEAAIRAARGEPVAKRIATGETLVTKENAGQFVQ